MDVSKYAGKKIIYKGERYGYKDFLIVLYWLTFSFLFLTVAIWGNSQQSPLHSNPGGVTPRNPELQGILGKLIGQGYDFQFATAIALEPHWNFGNGTTTCMLVEAFGVPTTDCITTWDQLSEATATGSALNGLMKTGIVKLIKFVIIPWIKTNYLIVDEIVKSCMGEEMPSVQNMMPEDIKGANGFTQLGFLIFMIATNYLFLQPVLGVVYGITLQTTGLLSTPSMKADIRTINDLSDADLAEKKGALAGEVYRRQSLRLMSINNANGNPDLRLELKDNDQRLLRGGGSSGNILSDNGIDATFNQYVEAMLDEMVSNGTVQIVDDISVPAATNSFFNMFSNETSPLQQNSMPIPAYGGKKRHSKSKRTHKKRKSNKKRKSMRKRRSANKRRSNRRTRRAQ